MKKINSEVDPGYSNILRKSKVWEKSKDDRDTTKTKGKMDTREIDTALGPLGLFW